MNIYKPEVNIYPQTKTTRRLFQLYLTVIIMQDFFYLLLLISRTYKLFFLFVPELNSLKAAHEKI